MHFRWMDKSMGNQISTPERVDGADSDTSGRTSFDRSSEQNYHQNDLDDDDMDYGHSDRDVLNNLPRFWSVIAPPSQSQSPKVPSRPESQSESPTRTKKKKSIRASSANVTTGQHDNSDPDPSPSVEPTTEMDWEIKADNSNHKDHPSSKRRKSKKRSKETAVPQPDKDEDTTQPFSVEFQSLSMSSQQSTSRTQLKDLEEGRVELPQRRSSDTTSPRRKKKDKKKDKKKKNKSKKQDGKGKDKVLEPVSDLATDPISDSDNEVEIPSSVRSFRKHELGPRISARSPKRRRLFQQTDHVEDFETQPFDDASTIVAPEGIVMDSQIEGSLAAARYLHHGVGYGDAEVQENSLGDSVKAGREDDSFAQEESPVVARQQRRLSSGPEPKATKRIRKVTPANESEAKLSNDATEWKQNQKSQYRSGPLSAAEQNQVCAAIETIRDNAGLSQEEMTRVIHENPRGQKDSVHAQLWKAVVESCPSRPRQKLINWCRQRFHNFVARGTWTEEQDEELERMIRIHGTKWSVIGGLINRHQKDVRDRYRNYLVYKGKANKDAWSSQEEDIFFQAIENAGNNIREDVVLENGDVKPAVEELINWHQISEAMGFSRTRLQCLEKWKRLGGSQALSQGTSTKLPAGNSRRLSRARKDLRRMTGQEKYALACAVRDSDAQEDVDINWKDIVNDTFDGKFERQALVVAWARLRETVPDQEEKTSAECAAHVTEMFEEDNGFLADDRTERSRSRASTAGTTAEPSEPRGRFRDRMLSKATVDPADDDSDASGGEEWQLPDLSAFRRNRSPGEEIEESVFGDVPEPVKGNAEMGKPPSKQRKTR